MTAHVHVAGAPSTRVDPSGEAITTYRCACGAWQRDTTGVDGLTWMGAWQEPGTLQPQPWTTLPQLP